MLAKRLRHSDCSYFEPYFRQHPDSHQKAINLDQDKIRSLFPSLTAAENTTKFPVQVNWFFGDQAAVETRQNISLSAKNWRLNSMPWVQADVDPDAIIVCQILGDEVDADKRVPTGVAFALLRDGDQGFDWLATQLSASGFVNLEDAELLAAEDWQEASPVWQLVNFLTRGLSEFVEDVVANKSSADIPTVGLRSIDRTGSTREAVDRLSRLRSAIGLGGETLVDALLDARCISSEYASYEWIASSNAMAPIDFRFDEGPDRVGIEVKTTKGPHDRTLAISTPELREAQRGSSHEIWRVSNFEFDEQKLRGTLRRADPSELVEETLLWMGTTPSGVSVPGVTFEPSAMSWTEAEEVTCPVSRIPSESWLRDMDLQS